MADRFDRFTERARRVLTFAQEEARRFDHNYIGSEHLLLALVREGDGVAGTVLANLGVELNKVRSAVEFIIGHGDRGVMGDIGLTPRAKKIIELAVDEARRLNHHYIGTEHLLLGMVREGQGIAAGVLESLGVSLERVRAETTRVLTQSMPRGEATGTGVGSFQFRVPQPGAADPSAPLDDSDLSDARARHKDTPIEELRLSVRAYNCLKRSELATVGQILAKSEDELLALRNFGMKSYVELRERLVEIGVLRASATEAESLPRNPSDLSPLGEAMSKAMGGSSSSSTEQRRFRQNVVFHDRFESLPNRSVALPVAFGLLSAFVVGYTAADDGWTKALIYLAAAGAALAIGWLAQVLLSPRRIG